MGNRRVVDLTDPTNTERSAETTVDDLMVSPVHTVQAGQSVAELRELLRENKLRFMPVVDDAGAPVGMVSITDLLDDPNDGARVASIMSEKVFSIPQYEKPEVAARIMRNHGFHHLVVTHEKKVIGILSTFDLLKLVENHRFVTKNAGTKTKGSGARKNAETD